MDLDAFLNVVASYFLVSCGVGFVGFVYALVCEELARWLCNTAVLVYYSIVTASYRMLGVGAWVTLGLGLFMRRVR